MPDARQQRLEALFHAALDLPPAQREAYLRSECDDDEMRDELAQLLAADDQQGQTVLPFAEQGWLDPDQVAPQQEAEAEADQEQTPAEEDAPTPTDNHPQQIGDYRILSYVAEGGMGVVYKAEQQNPQRHVALKVIRPDFATPATLRRFEYEASVLGRLHHPGIAQIYEAGTATNDHGREIAFFAMEFIKGRELRAHAEAHELDHDDRLALMAEVCDAVEHAHRNGVIHRDLKPANILVTYEEQPKVLDFGIARAVDAEMQHTQTGAGQLVGTIPYMSPEQFSGNPDAIDTRCDVYALGVTLYELLADSLPHDLREKSILDAARIIQNDPPTQLGSVQPKLRGDVETIVNTALAKDPGARYNSAAALAEDIRRYLRKETILARPPTAIYQLSRFAARNKLLVAASLLILNLLLFGLLGISWQYLQAEAARDLAEDRKQKAEELADVAEKERAAAVVAMEAAEDARAAEFIQRRRAEQNEVLAEQEKEKALRVARFLKNVLIKADPRRALGTDVKVIDALDAAADRLARTSDRLAPDVAAELHSAIGYSYLRLGDLRRCEPHLVAALAKREEARPQRRDLTAVNCTYLAELRVLQQDYTTADELMQRALDLLAEELGPDHPQYLTTWDNYATLLRKSGQLREAAETYRQLLAALINAPEQEALRATVSANLGRVLWELREFEASAEHLEGALTLQRSLLPENHPTLATTLSDLGYVLTELGAYPRANAALDEALSMQRAVLPAGHYQLASTQTLRGAGLLAQEMYPEAEVALREALAIRRESLPDGHWQIANTRNLLGAALSRMGRATEAEVMLLESWERLASNDATPDARLRDAAARIADHFDLSDQPDRAKIWRDRAE